MRTNTIFLLSSAVALLVMAGFGCVTAVDGRVQGGVPFVKDRMQAQYERPVMEVWTAAKDVLNYNGKLYSEDVQKSTLEAAINHRTVWVKVEPVDPVVTRVIVQARGSMGGGDVALAGEIDKQIALRLATGNLSPAAQGASK